MRRADGWTRLLPREHGATTELGFAVVSGLVLGQVTLPGVALAVAFVLAFFAHEPAAVLRGWRGPHARRALGRLARPWLWTVSSAAATVGLVGILLGGLELAVALLLPAALFTVLVLALVAGAPERSTPVELLVAATLAAVVVPLGVAGGASATASGAVATVWAISFSVGTLAARGVLLRRKDGGRRLRTALLSAGLVTSAGLFSLAAGAPWGLALGPLPWAAAAALTWAVPPPPDRMARLGVSLVLASALTFASLTLGAA